MAQVTIVDKDNAGLPAIIWKDNAPIAVADIDGNVTLENGSYVAKIIGHEDTPFEVKGDAYVVMKDKDFEEKAVEIKAKPTTWKKWVKLGVLGLVIFGVVKYLSVKK
jgi:hypothetical protein